MVTYRIMERATGDVLIDGLTQLDADKWLQERKKYGHDRSEYIVEAE